MIAKLSVFCFFVEMNGSLFCRSILIFLRLTFFFGPADLNRRIVPVIDRPIVPKKLIIKSAFHVKISFAFCENYANLKRALGCDANAKFRKSFTSFKHIPAGRGR